MPRVIVFVLTLTSLALAEKCPAGARICTGDLVVVTVSGRVPEDAAKHSQLSARIRVALREDRTVSKATLDQSSGYQAIDGSLLKTFGQWTFLKATKCDVVLIPVRVQVKSQ